MSLISHRLSGRDQAILIVEAPPELHHDCAEPLRATVTRHLPNRDDAALILDMSSVVLVSSIGVATLLQIHEFCHDRGAALIIAGAPTRHVNFLRMLKLDRKFEFADSVEDAMDRLNRSVE